MTEYDAGIIDVAVIGAGHAGIEAALASARLGVSVALFSISMDTVANLPCNPSIGGTAKGHLVREIDALGGEMGKAADAVFIQSRMLNRGKGPAVHSLRAQVDREKYSSYMKMVLEEQKGLVLKQAEIVDIRLEKNNKVAAVVTALGAVYRCKAAIVCTGTYLRGRIFVGEHSYSGGPDGVYAPSSLSERFESIGIRMRRFKTGTPARVHRDSIDFTKLEPQNGDDPVTPFSFETTWRLYNRIDCHIAYTNEKTHEVIRRNLHRSPLYSGDITGVGPRYCPSIEDKVVRFADKLRHQVFVEPMGLNTREMYLQGMSSSLPEDVQIELYRTIKGFENIQIIRNAYAIEYDCVDPTQLLPTLEFKKITGLYGAGQFNGSSGYEEAAAQGLIAGINAVQFIKGKKPFILKRSSSYTGTLIDDLVTKGCSDPYRIMTSRSEFRLLLRQDNADERLTPLGYEIGLITKKRWEMFHVKQERIDKEIKRLDTSFLSPSPGLNILLEKMQTSPVRTGVKLTDLIRRPQISYESLKKFDLQRPVLPKDVTEEAEIRIKYEGYIKKQFFQAEQMLKLDDMPLPKNINYKLINGIRLEAKEKLEKLRPVSLGHASRISGVNPSDISVLLIYLESGEAKGQ